MLGRGGAGKSVLAQRLAEQRQLPLIELDQHFWTDGPHPMPAKEWEQAHAKIIGQDRWVIDGDLGPYDIQLTQRLTAADTIIVLDLPLPVCVWRAWRRSHETWEFWRWVIRYRRDSVPIIKEAIISTGSRGKVHWFSARAEVERYLGRVLRS